MKLNIPEIGDKLTLSKDFKFKLYAEYRNEKIGNYFGYNFEPDKKIFPGVFLDKKYGSKPDQSKLIFPKFYAGEKKPGLFSKRYNYKEYADEFYKLNGKTFGDLDAELVQFLVKKEKYGKKYLDITLPKNTILTVDRIYIRKGNKEYSSVSFWAKMSGINKKIRFWAKLEDVNNIEFIP